ncbi:hypothetical protein ACFYZ8_33480 [Streptomyces sp. NPDC001668]|uniref:hypothetical protein n=1 Tax=Streptomyces sp. NPDC001668 TaxID=3364598 RepID=UPI0036C2A185
MGADISITGRVTFDTAVPLEAIGQELEHLRRLENDDQFTLTYTTDGLALAGLEAGPQHMAGSHGVWDGALATLSDIARRQRRTLHAEATWISEPGPYRGVLVVDAGNRFHHVPDDEGAAAHRERSCDCYGSGPGRVRPEDVTDDPSVRIDEVGAGPFTDHIVVCDRHGEVAALTSRSGAVDAREAHLLEKHTPEPVPLGQQAALDLLPMDLRYHIVQAAKQLGSLSPYLPGSLALRADARSHARKARQVIDSLTEQSSADVVGQLVDALVEQLVTTAGRDAHGSRW